MKNNVLSLTVALVVGVILVGSLVAPTITALTDETRTYTNEGMPFAEVDDDTHTIVVTSSAITVDGEDVDLSLFPGTFTQYSIVYGESGFIRYETSNVVVRAVNSTSSYSFPFASNTVTITIEGTTATVSSSDTSVTSRTVSDVTHYISTEGDYVMALNPVVSSDSGIYGAGETYFATSTWSIPSVLDVFTTWSGDMSAVTGTIVLWYSSTNYDTCVISDATINTTDLGDGLYQIDSVIIDYTATKDSTDYEVYSTYTYFLAPAEIVYDNPDYVGSTLAPIMLAIIVVTILALVMMAARNVTRD